MRLDFDRRKLARSGVLARARKEREPGRQLQVGIGREIVLALRDDPRLIEDRPRVEAFIDTGAVTPQFAASPVARAQ